MAGFYEQGDMPSGCIKDGKFLDQLNESSCSRTLLREVFQSNSTGVSEDKTKLYACVLCSVTCHLKVSSKKEFYETGLNMETMKSTFTPFPLTFQLPTLSSSGRCQPPVNAMPNSSPLKVIL